ncbi:MAG: DUF4349 domain-containing protein [Bacteroidota bacterium]
MRYLSLVFLFLIVGCMDRSSAIQADETNPDRLGLLNSNLGSYEYTNSDDFLVEAVEESTIQGLTPDVILPQPEQKIIKTADLSFESPDLLETHKEVVLLAKELGGFVSSDRFGKSSRQLYHNMTVRIPTKNFRSFIDEISKGVSYFDRKNISQRDVSEEFVDLEARIKAKRELEKRYLELLTQARNVEEMLNIERELSTIREEIEAKQGRLNYLKDQVSMSTLSVQFYKYTSQTGITVSYGQKMKNSLAGGWDGISLFFLGLLSLWPVILGLILAVWLIRRWLRRRRRKKLLKSQKAESSA